MPRKRKELSPTTYYLPKVLETEQEVLVDGIHVVLISWRQRGLILEVERKGSYAFVVTGLTGTVYVINFSEVKGKE